MDVKFSLLSAENLGCVKHEIVDEIASVPVQVVHVQESNQAAILYSEVPG